MGTSSSPSRTTVASSRSPPDGEIFWEFLHTGIKPGARAAIYRMMRLTQEQLPALAFPEAVKQKLRKRGYLAAG
jgi:hypothetical protein